MRAAVFCWRCSLLTSTSDRPKETVAIVQSLCHEGVCELLGYVRWQHVSNAADCRDIHVARATRGARMRPHAHGRIDDNSKVESGLTKGDAGVATLVLVTSTRWRNFCVHSIKASVLSPLACSRWRIIQVRSSRCRWQHPAWHPPEAGDRRLKATYSCVSAAYNTILKTSIAPVSSA